MFYLFLMGTPRNRKRGRESKYWHLLLHPVNANDACVYEIQSGGQEQVASREHDHCCNMVWKAIEAVISDIAHSSMFLYKSLPSYE